jgi:Putative Actinobacterial Holin-X, holin superfamily III
MADGNSERQVSLMSIDKDIQTTKSDLRTVSALVGEALSQFAKLFQNEVDLAKAEFGEKFRTIGGAMGLVGAGAVLVIPGLVMALFALSTALIGAGWSQPISYLLSAILALVVAGILFAIGMSRLNTQNLAPRETMRQLDKDKNTVKGIIR